MRTTLFFAFVIWLTGCANNAEVKGDAVVSTRDSGCAAERVHAIKDFESGSFEIDNYRLPDYSLYAEEILFLKYGIKVEVGMPYFTCGTGREENDYYWWRASYDETIDSLMTSRFGRDIYERTLVSADSFKRLFPARYDTTFFTPGPYLSGADSVVTQKLKKFISDSKFVEFDTLKDVMWVQLEIDSVGNIDTAFVTGGIRSDVDSVAIDACRRLDKFTPAFRWGAFQADTYVMFVRFPLE